MKSSSLLQSSEIYFFSAQRGDWVLRHGFTLPKMHMNWDRTRFIINLFIYEKCCCDWSRSSCLGCDQNISPCGLFTNLYEREMLFY